MAGRDFLATVEANGVSTFGLGKSAMLSPAYFSTTMLGNLARSFERYRWKRLRIHYIPKVPTTVTGQVILCSNRSVTEPNLQPEAGNFLPKAMSQGNAVFSPLWTPTYIDIDCDADWHLVDPATSVDIDDAIHEELQVYTQVSVAQQVGYLVAEYDVEFKEPIFAPHSTLIPIATGPGVRVTMTDVLAVNNISDDWLLTPTAGITFGSVPNGSIYRGVLDLQGSTAATGTTFNNMLNYNVLYRTTTAVQTTSVTGFALVGGTTLYFVVVGNNTEVYTSIEAATNGNGSGQLFFQTATTAIGTYLFDMALIRYGPGQLPAVQ